MAEWGHLAVAALRRKRGGGGGSPGGLAGTIDSLRPAGEAGDDGIVHGMGGRWWRRDLNGGGGEKLG